MSDQAVTNTSDALGSEGTYSNQRLKCGLGGDRNCQDALDRCQRLALTNPFPPPQWLSDILSLLGSKPNPQPPKPNTNP
jgi:hypothetical protein